MGNVALACGYAGTRLSMPMDNPACGRAGAAARGGGTWACPISRRNGRARRQPASSTHGTRRASKDPSRLLSRSQLTSTVLPGRIQGHGRQPPDKRTARRPLCDPSPTAARQCRSGPFVVRRHPRLAAGYVWPQDQPGSLRRSWCGPRTSPVPQPAPCARSTSPRAAAPTRVAAARSAGEHLCVCGWHGDGHSW